MITIIGIFIIILILIIFVSSIWRDEIKNNTKIFEINESNLIQDSKKSHIDKQVFLQGLKNIDIQNVELMKLKNEIGKIIIGMDDFINSIIISLLVGGHLLIEGVPGLAKTKTIDTLSKALDLNSKRVQFTPDMLPSDIIGVEIFNSKILDFEIKKGPIFTNILLADEINRTTPKVQSALLEAMQENRVSIGNNTFILPKPFFVLATQNPIEQEGTYQLPEAQIDRFLFKVIVDYPTFEQEKNILNTLEIEESITINKIIDIETLILMQNNVKLVKVSNEIKDYIARLIFITREKNDKIVYGCSPRGSIGLMIGAKAVAYIQGRDYVIHEDVQRILINTLRHRIILSYDTKFDGINEDQFLADLMSKITLE